jgi:hypothetical protein
MVVVAAMVVVTAKVAATSRTGDKPMAGKTNSRNWNDVQMVIIATALVLTLTLWNLFAGPDRVKADKAQNAPVAQTTESSPVAILPDPTEPIKIMLGGAAPA